MQRDALDAAITGTLRALSSVNEAIRQGCLAAHPDIRSEFARLVKLRDDVWAADTATCRAFLHGPSQILVDIMTRCRNRAERHHVANASAYLAYLRHRLANR